VERGKKGLGESVRVQIWAENPLGEKRVRKTLQNQSQRGEKKQKKKKKKGRPGGHMKWKLKKKIKQELWEKRGPNEERNKGITIGIDQHEFSGQTFKTPLNERKQRFGKRIMKKLTGGFQFGGENGIKHSEKEKKGDIPDPV